MQLSLVELMPELKKCLFLDVFAKMTIDARTKRPTLRTLEGQRVPPQFKIRCLPGSINAFPEGTIYKLDVRLVELNNKKPYFSAISNKGIGRAVEFFEHNLSLQKGTVPNSTACSPTQIPVTKTL